jgi:glutamine cyclotransferase
MPASQRKDSRAPQPGLTALWLIALLSLLTACRQETGSGLEGPPTQAAAPSGEIPVHIAEVVNQWPHDTSAFTQGLIFHAGTLYESTGGEGRSSLRQVELETGQVLRKVEVPRPYFAEGLTLLKGRLFQLTWLSQKGFIYDLESLRPLGEFSYTGEGWGLTNDGSSLIMSDGTHQLRFLDPDDFIVRRTISVYDGSRPLRELNELEYIKGELYANIWHDDRIARIDPQSGKLLGWIDLRGLLAPSERRDPEAVLNGIAYDAAQDRLFVTGKLWPKLFEIRLKRKQTALPSAGS